MRFARFAVACALIPLLAGWTAFALEYTALPPGTPPMQALQVRLDKLEQLLEQAGDYQRYILLDTAARTALELKQYDKAREYASELQVLAEHFPLDWNYSSALHQSRIILGKLALQDGDIASAKRFLLAAASVPLSDALNQRTPDLTLAQSLLDKGEKDAVLDYLRQCKKIWPDGGDKLDYWLKHIARGEKVRLAAS